MKKETFDAVFVICSFSGCEKEGRREKELEAGQPFWIELSPCLLCLFGIGPSRPLLENFSILELAMWVKFHNSLGEEMNFLSFPCGVVMHFRLNLQRESLAGLGK